MTARLKGEAHGGLALRHGWECASVALAALYLVASVFAVALVPRDARAYDWTEGCRMATKRRPVDVREPSWNVPLRAAIVEIRKSGSSAGLGSFFEAVVNRGLEMDLWTSHAFRTWLEVSGGRVVGSVRSSDERADAARDLLRVAARLVYRAEEVARGRVGTSPDDVARIVRQSTRLEGKIDRLIAFARFASTYDFEFDGMGREDRERDELRAIEDLGRYLDHDMQAKFVKHGIMLAARAGEAWRKGPGRDRRDGHPGKYDALARVAKCLGFHVADSTIEKAVKSWNARQRRLRRASEARRKSG